MSNVKELTHILEDILVKEPRYISERLFIVWNYFLLILASLTISQPLLQRSLMLNLQNGVIRKKTINRTPCTQHTVY